MKWSALKTAVAGWANRTDITALMPTFLELAEQRIYNGMRDERGNVKVRQLLLSRMYTTLSPFTTATIPDDNVQIDRLVVTTGTQRRALEFRPLSEIARLQSNAAGVPGFYSIQGQTVIYGPPLGSSSSAELLYYARFPTPSADTDENWLMANASSVYLYAMLIEVGIWLRDNDMRDSNIELWAAAQNAVMAQDDQDQHSGSPLRVVNDAMTRW